MISEIKREAKASLKGKWGMAIVVFLVASLIIGLLGSTGILELLLGAAMIGGVLIAFENGMENEFKFEDLFEGFKNGLGNRIVLSVLKSIFITLWSLLFVIPGIIKSYSWAMAEYISMKNPDYDYKKCLDESARMMKGHKWEYFVLQLSFIGWIILSCFTFGLLFILYVGPYMQASETKFIQKMYNDNTVAPKAEEAVYTAEAPASEEAK